jgi:hypothetical protein
LANLNPLGLLLKVQYINVAMHGVAEAIVQWHWRILLLLSVCDTIVAKALAWYGLGGWVGLGN